MVSSDTVVGIVGAVILTGAMIAVFYYENSTADDGPSDIVGTGDNLYTFTYEQADATAIDGDTATLTPDSNSKTHRFTLPAYVYMVEATVTWTETGEAVTLPGEISSGGDQFTVTLLNEAGADLGSDTNRSSPITVHHGHGPGDTNTTPPQETVRVRGNTTDEARQHLATATADAHGAGEWQVVVVLDDVGEGQTAAQIDSGNDYTITVTYSYWQPVAEESDTS